MMKLFSKIKLQTKILLLGGVILILAISVGGIVILRIVDTYFNDIALDRGSHAMSEIIHQPLVAQALINPTPENTNALVNLTNIIQRASIVDFIVIIDMDGIRLTHPNPNKIGLLVEGDDVSDVFLGKSYTSMAAGTLGRSLRLFEPVYNGGQQVGAIIIGITVESINLMAAKIYMPIMYFLAFILCVTVVSTVYLAKHIKKILNNLEPHEIARMLEEKNSMFRTVKEGVIVINTSGYISLINDAAKRILGLDNRIEGNFFQQNIYKIDDYLANSRLEDVMKSQMPEYDSEQKLDNTIIITNRVPLIVKGKVVGAMATFRDMTELRKLAERLIGVKRYLEALRVQQHDFSNKMHVIHGLFSTQSYDDLGQYLNALMYELNEEENSLTVSVKDPILLSYLHSKLRHASELGINLDIDIQNNIDSIYNKSIAYSLVTLLGNLINNAFDAVANEDVKDVTVIMSLYEGQLLCMVEDSGKGIKPDDLDKIMNKGYSSKGEGRGYGLYIILNILSELNGKISFDSGKKAGFGVSIQIPQKNIW